MVKWCRFFADDRLYGMRVLLRAVRESQPFTGWTGTGPFLGQPALFSRKDDGRKMDLSPYRESYRASPHAVVLTALKPVCPRP